MPQPSVFQDLHFPKAGMDVANAFGRQPARQVGNGEYARTTRFAKNVRCFEPESNRTRGASRCGLVKYVAGLIPSTEPEFIIQHLDVIVTAGSGAVQTSQLGRIVTTVAVVEGKLFRLIAGGTAFEAVTNNTGNDPPLNDSGLMQSAANSQKLWFADGNNWCYYDPNDNTINTWSATAGQLPSDSEGNLPTLICNWRGRIVVSGLPKDPQNIFMSKVLDPRNWDYFPVPPGATDAVAGNNPTSFGLIGDVVTALIPWSDDNLIVGCDSSIFVVAGDPLAGGQVKLITRAIGMAFGAAWCMDPTGTVYFFSNRCGVFAMKPDAGEPVRISSAIENELQAIDTGANGICMAWDDKYQGLHLFISPLAEPGTGNNWYWDQRNNAWFKDEFTNVKHNPLTVVAFDGNEPTDRVLLIGSWDGYVRSIDPTATDDDSYAIVSEVWIGPLTTKDLDDVTLRSIQVVLGENSGEVTWAIHAGATAEAAFNSEAMETGTCDPSRNLRARVKVADHAIYIKLSSTANWSMESIRAETTLNGKVRQRGR